MARRILHGTPPPLLAARVAEREIESMAPRLESDGAALAAYLLATVRAQIGDDRGALSALAGASDRTGAHPLLALGLGEQYLRMDRPSEAVAHLESAVRGDLRGIRRREDALELLARARSLAEPIPIDEDAIEIVEEIPARRTSGGRIADLREVLDTDPGRIDALEALAALLPERARVTCESLLALLDRHPAQNAAPPAIHGGDPPPGLADALFPPELRQPAAIGATLWTHVPALFRQDLDALGVCPEDRLSPLSGSVLAALFGSARRTLDLPRTALFVRRSSDVIAVALTTPPAVVAGAGARMESPAARFRLVRAIAATRPEHLLWSGLPVERAWAAYDAVRWAFGRTEEEETSVARASVLGREYRRLLPPRVQRELRERLAASPLPPFETARRLGEIAVHRAALVVLGDLGTAIRVVAEDAPELQGTQLSLPSGLASAIRRSELATDLVRFATSACWPALRAVDLPDSQTTRRARPAAHG